MRHPFCVIYTVEEGFVVQAKTQKSYDILLLLLLLLLLLFCQYNNKNVKTYSCLDLNKKIPPSIRLYSDCHRRSIRLARKK